MLREAVAVQVGVELMVKRVLVLELLQFPAQLNGARQPLACLLQPAALGAQALLVRFQSRLSFPELRLS